MLENSGRVERTTNEKEVDNYFCEIRKNIDFLTNNYNIIEANVSIYKRGMFEVNMQYCLPYDKDEIKANWPKAEIKMNKNGLEIYIDELISEKEKGEIEDLYKSLKYFANHKIGIPPYKSPQKKLNFNKLH